MIVVQRPAGARQEERARTARARERARGQQPRVERLAAARAPVAVGEQRALDVGDDQVAAGDRDRGERTVGELCTDSRSNQDGAGAGAEITIGSSIPVAGRAGEVPVTIGRPAPPTVCGATPSTSRPSRSGAASSSACLIASSSVTDDAEQSEQLPRRWIRATPCSSDSSSTLPPCDSMYGRTESSAACTRCSSGTGCRSWISSSVATSPSSASEAAIRSPSGPASSSARDDPLQAGAVHLHDRRDELLGQLARDRLAAQLELGLELLDALDELLEALCESAVRIHPSTPTPSGCA